MLFEKFTLHDFPAFALFSQTIVKMSEGTFCRVGVHILLLGRVVCMESKIVVKVRIFNDSTA